MNNSEDLFNLMMSMDDTPQIRKGTVRSPFGFPGGKSRSLDKILPHLPYRNTYCEPFGGSAAILLCRNESPLEVYNDRFGGVVSFYRCLRDKDKMEKLIELITLTPHSREEFTNFQSTWEGMNSEIDRAHRWYCHHQMSFGNQGRHFGRCTSKKSQMGRKLKTNLKFFEPCHQRLQNVQIENLDWRVCIRDYDNSETVFYLDPPYVKYAHGVYKHEFTRSDHVELSHRIFTLQGFVALSGYDDPDTQQIYGHLDWDDIYRWETNCSMLGLAFSDTNNLAAHKDNIHRKEGSEILFIKRAECDR
jgi:DNA adenine methylase